MTHTTNAIESFLKTVPINHASDLTSRCVEGMEVQVMVDPTGGEPVYDGDKLIRNTWQVCSDEYGTYNYHHIRIPKNAMSEPYYNNPTIRFPLQRHVEYIGMTGWNWKKKKSFWVAFDFDAITNHAAGVGVSDESLNSVKVAASKIPWVQVRRSTGGSGLHLYTFFDPENAPETENHNVHAALARTVLGLMEREAGFDFRANMDVLGGNMWIWSRGINNENRGLSIIKDYEDFCPRLPDNWRENLDVVTGVSAKVRFKGVSDNDYDSFESQASARIKIEIDDTHKLIEERIHSLGYSIVWIPDHHCWQTHSKALQDLMDEYPEDYLGVFKTLSSGSDKGKPNCFIFPINNGGLRVTRFGKGSREHETWNQDNTDWTWTYFNRSPSLMEASAIFGGAEDPDGKGWVFNNFEDVQQTCRALGDELPLDESWIEVFGEAESRNIVLRANKQDQLVIEIDRKKDDKVPAGWIGKRNKFIRLMRTIGTEPVGDEEEVTYDDRVRALVDTNNEFSQWTLLDEEGKWVGQNKDNTRSALRIWAGDKAEEVLGRLVIKNWKMVNVPFQPEYLGHRRWNRNAPQFAVSPGESGQEHPHWDLVLDHTGQDLDDVILEDQWCKEAGIFSGAEYLTYWLSFVLRDPFCKLPYLFFYGPQNSGKSIFHEAASLLVTRGVHMSDEALKSKGNFNGELAGSVLCVVEETNLSSHGSSAYDRMKSWVTAEDILIHAKYQQPYQIKNTTHWVQMANDKSFCPIFPGDTRVVMMYVPMLDRTEIPKDTLLLRLKEEAPAFLRRLLDLKLPNPPGRLRLPTISTESKRAAEEALDSVVTKFIEEKCHPIPGAITKLIDFNNSMREWMTKDQSYAWTPHKVADEFRNQNLFPFGRALNNITCIGNLSLEPRQDGIDYGVEWIRFRQKLMRKEDE